MKQVRQVIGDTYKIYCLKDPYTLEVKYIGSTKNALRKRLNGHYSQRNHVKKYRWLKHLSRQNKRAIIETLELVDRLQVKRREFYWVQHYKKMGCSLFNLAIQTKIDLELFTK